MSNKDFLCKYQPFEIPLMLPIGTGPEALHVRRGVYVMLYDEHDRCVGLGEAAPLPGFSSESFNDVKTELLGLDRVNADIIMDLHSPSLQFAFESALMMQDTSLSESVACHAFMGWDAQQMPPLADDVGCIKLKVGMGDVLDEKKRVQALFNHHPSCRFRLDANGRFTLEEALYFFGDLPADQIDYIEDPCESSSDYPEFHKKTGLFLAVDFPYDIDPFDGIKAVVLKPSLIGGRDSLIRISQKYEGVKSVMSSCFETLVGLSAVLRYAAAFNPCGIHGVNTQMYYQVINEQPAFLKALSLKDCLNWVNTHG